MDPDIYLHPDLRAAIGIPDFSRLYRVTRPSGDIQLLVLNDWQKAVLLKAEPEAVCATFALPQSPKRRRVSKSMGIEKFEFISSS